MIEGFTTLSYEERLVETGLTTLVDRRIRGDLIETFKMVKGISTVDYRHFFNIAEVNTGVRRHRYKLTKERSRLNIRADFFSQRVVNHWNHLPEEVVETQSTNSFKNRLDKFVRKNLEL